ncbi:MAG: sulfite exporter TauE/SafE family protein [Pseudomonadota bacterium]|nr:sulfite exporter TauE/SafE family protein [Pseudomonadota bacterium]
MENFMGVPDVSLSLMVGLVIAATITTFLGTVTGTAGGLLLLAGMTFFFPLAVLVPMHTMIQLGAGTSRMFMMWRYVKKNLILPFAIGSVIGAFAGAQIFTTLPSEILQGILGVFILVVLYTPKLGAGGPERLRFGVLGGVATFLGIFVSATGTFLSPFVAHASQDRHIHVSTMATLMAISHVSKLVAFGFVGMAIGAYLPLIVLMMLGTVAGNWVGQRTLTQMPEKLFRRIFQILLTILAVRLLVGAALDAGWFKGFI